LILHRLFWVGILLLICQSSRAQLDAGTGLLFTKEQFIKGCANYRARVLHELEDEMISFAEMADSLAMTSSHPEVHQQLMVELLKGMLPENREMDSGAALRAAQKLFNNDMVSMIIYKEWFDQNGLAISELGFLVGIGLLEEQPPYKLANLKNLWEEFSFYQFKEGMTIADIGAGNGFLSFILLESGFKADLLLTEIDKDFLNFLELKVQAYQRIHTEGSVRLIRAYNTSLGLGDRKVDCMILREVFHHLEDPDAILADAKKHLTPGGCIILSEATRDLEIPKSERCNKATTYDKILKSMTEAGFQLIDKNIIDNSYMLRFKQGI
jgi:SAM-dependent methyltransferase